MHRDPHEMLKLQTPSSTLDHLRLRNVLIPSGDEQGSRKLLLEHDALPVARTLLRLRVVCGLIP